MKKKLLSMGLYIIMILTFTGCSMGKSQYDDGKKSFVTGNYEEAAKHFAAAITQNSNRAEYYIDYGLTLIALGRYEDALSQFNQVYIDKDILVVRQNNKRILRGRGIAYYNMQQFDNAILEFQAALQMDELSGLDMDILYYMGNSYMMLGSYEEAIDIFSKILEKNNKRITAYINRAICYRNMGEYEKSLQDYDTALTLEPNNYDPYLGKYDLLRESGDQAGAVEILAKAADINVKTNEDKYNLAKVHYYQEDYELALVELNEGITNGFTEANYYIGELYQAKKDYQKAVYFYDIFIKEGIRTNPNVYNQMAYCLMKLLDYKKAREYLEIGISFNHKGTLQVLKKNEIIVYESLGMFKEAMEKLEDYLANYSEDEDAIREVTFLKTRLMEAVTKDDSVSNQ
jgi:tetratricopeptide (TPR) repeat protein